MNQGLLNEFIRERIKHYMLLENITAYQLSTACDLPKSSLYKSLNGSTLVDTSIVEALCNLLCISQREFYEPYDSTHSFNTTPVTSFEDGHSWSRRRAQTIYKAKKSAFDRKQREHIVSPEALKEPSVLQ